MKKAYALLAFFSLSAQADILLPVVEKYQIAENTSLWQKSKTDKLPEMLISEVSLKDPNNSYSALFPKSFLQNTNLLVCYNDCAKDSFSGVKDGMLKFNSLQLSNVVEQSTIYYWLNSYLNFLEERFHFKPKHFLKAYSSRIVKDEKNSKMRNNAFFLPSDKTLSFLPADKSILFKLLGGKINRSGFDPSVIIHEAGHFYFNHLFENAVNQEINGLNEGFADYLANIVLNNSKVGLVMLQGKALRDSNKMLTSEGKLKSYEPGKEVHDLGEGIAYLLWETRKRTTNPEEFDRLVVDAIKEIAQNPYSSVHDFKEAMIDRTNTILSGQSLKEILNLWEMLFPGKANAIANLDFLNASLSGKRVAFDISQIVSENMAQTFGVDQTTKINLEVVGSVAINAKQTAIMISHKGQDLWVAVDTERKNILGIFEANGDLVTDSKRLEELSNTISNLINFSDFIKGFAANLKQFAGLLEGKGELSYAYKLSKVTTTKSTRVINGQSQPTTIIKMNLKKRIISRILGLPDITDIELHTAAVNTGNMELPELNRETIIGFKLSLKGGTTQEMILTKF